MIVVVNFLQGRIYQLCVSLLEENTFQFFFYFDTVNKVAELCTPSRAFSSVLSPDLSDYSCTFPPSLPLPCGLLLLQGNSLAFGQVGQSCGGIQENGVATEERQHLAQGPSGSFIIQNNILHWQILYILSSFCLHMHSSVLQQILRKASQ